jgi:hypothetical protein
MGNLETRIMMFLLFLFTFMASASTSSNLSLGVKNGQWIKYGSQETFSPGGERWQKIEFLSVTGTTITIRVIVHMSVGIETDQTETIDLATSDDFSMALFNVRVYIIPADLKMSDFIYLGVFGNRTISDETTKAYAGADRRVVYSNFSQNGNQYTFYWDKQTGVLTEGTMVFGAAFKTLWVTETNMWEAELGWWFWAIIIIIVVCGVVASRKSIIGRLHRKDEDQGKSLTATRFASAMIQESITQQFLDVYVKSILELVKRIIE